MKTWTKFGASEKGTNQKSLTDPTMSDRPYNDENVACELQQQNQGVSHISIRPTEINCDRIKMSSTSVSTRRIFCTLAERWRPLPAGDRARKARASASAACFCTHTHVIAHTV